MSQAFKGPLFIIGKPRSGTKLLARIFEKHPDIAIEVSETKFIPYYLKHPEIITDMDKKENFDKFYDSVTKKDYFSSYHKNIIDVNEWYNLCTDYSFYNVLEVLLKYYSNSIDKPNSVWGDKSNNYINYVKLLKRHFPTSRFIHIIRDVRDASLSSFKAWKTNVYRYSQRWSDDVNKIRKDFMELSAHDYLEFTYEELLRVPEKTIKRCLNFIGVEYFDDILNLKSPSEAVGGAKGLTTIKSDNMQKYKRYFSEKQIRKIESITWPLLKTLNYDYNYNGHVRHLTGIEMRLYQSLDIFNRLKFDIKRDGTHNIFKILKGNLLHLKHKYK